MLWLHIGQRRKRSEALRAPSAALGRPRVENHSTAHGAPRRRVAQHDSISMEGADRATERNLGERFLARQQPLTIKHREPRWSTRSADVEVDWRQMVGGSLLARHQPDARVEAVRRGMERHVDDPIAAADTILFNLRADEVERAALPRIAALCRRILGVQGAHPRSEARRREEKPVADPD